MASSVILLVNSGPNGTDIPEQRSGGVTIKGRHSETIGNDIPGPGAYDIVERPALMVEKGGSVFQSAVFQGVMFDPHLMAYFPQFHL